MGLSGKIWLPGWKSFILLVAEHCLKGLAISTQLGF